jgi:chorismate mutase
MFSAILGIIEAALSIWSSKLRQKYIDRVGEIKRAYYEEYNKPDAERSDAVLDNLANELCIAAQELATEIRIANA